MKQGRDREFRVRWRKGGAGNSELGGVRDGKGVQSALEQGKDREFIMG